MSEKSSPISTAHQKIARAQATIRQNGYTQPVSIELTIAEIAALHELTDMTLQKIREVIRSLDAPRTTRRTS